MDTPFRVLVERYQQRTYRAAYRVLVDRQEALDVTQEALLALHQRRRDIPEARAGAWLARVATNRALDQLRRRATAQRVQAAFAPREAGGPPDELAERAEEGERALRALGHLSGRQREVITLRILEHMTFPAIAGALGISEGAAKVYFSRGLRALRARVERGEPAGDTT